MSARAEHTPEAAARSVEHYIDTNDIKGDSASRALLETANESVSEQLNSQNMPSSEFSTELEKSGVLPKLAVNQFDKIAAVDGDGTEISGRDLDIITSDKSGKFDAFTRLAADYISRNKIQIAESDNGILNFNLWDEFAADRTIDREEMETFVLAKDYKFRANDPSYRQHQGREIENMAADIGNFLFKPEGDRDVDKLRLDSKLQDEGFTDPGSERVQRLMKAMERNGTAGDFIAQQLDPDVKDYLGEHANVTKDDLRTIASNDRSQSRRLAAQLALRNFEAIDRSDDGITSLLSDTDSLSQAELRAYAKQSLGKTWNFVRQPEDQVDSKPKIQRSDVFNSVSSVREEDVSEQSSEKSSEQELKELILNEGLGGEERVLALVNLLDSGVNSIEMKVGEKTETAKIHYSEGTGGMPDSIYLFDGEGNPILRAHVERGDDSDVVIKKQHAGSGADASFEGTRWSDRVRQTEGIEAALSEEANIESKADTNEVLEDESSSIQQKLEAIFKTKNDREKVTIRTEDGKVIEGTVRKNEAGWVGIAGPDGRFFVKGQMRGGEIVPDNAHGHWANKSRLHNYRELVMAGWTIE